MRTGVQIEGSGRSPQQLTEEILSAARRGFAHAWVNQHPTGWDPLSVLAAAGLSGGPELALGTAVVPTYPRHPVALAAQALTVQAATGGRLTLGIGPSHPSIVTGQLGIPFTAPAGHTREYLRILLPLLRGERVEHHGEQLTAVTQLDIAAGPPPGVLLAALGPAMLRIAGELTGGTIAIWVRPNLVAEHIVPKLLAATPSGAAPRVVVMAITSVTADPDGVRASVAEGLGGAGDLPAYRAILDRGGLSGPADTVIAGDERTVAKELARFSDAGVTDLVVVPWGSAADTARTLDIVAGLATGH